MLTDRSSGPTRVRRWRPIVGGAALVLGAIALLATVVPATAAPRSAGSVGSAKVAVVAAENFWGSIVAQIGGGAVSVTSIITNPNTDPHEYEPSAADARTVAESALVIENGVGYDPWVGKLVDADGSTATVLDVGRSLGLTVGDNPHRWYNPANVKTIVAVMVTDLAKLDPSDAARFRANAQRFETTGLATYHALITEIRSRYSGTPVGASESIFAMLAPALGLDLITPPTFLRAISEGTDVSAADKATIDRQIADHRIKIYVYNSQNATPDIATQIAECKRAGIPLATITETLSPAGVSYESWQVQQLRGILAAALERATQDVTGTPTVEFDRATARLGGRTIWSDVTFVVEPGEFVAVLGPNGVGKSTLVRTALGVLPLAVGTVRVLGMAPGEGRSAVGYLPQRRSFDPSIRIRGVDLVRLGLDGHRWGVPLPLPLRYSARRRADEERIAEVIALVGAESYARRSIGELSGGEQQRLLIAQALVHHPRILFLDEPLDSLDLPNQRAISSLIASIAAAEEMSVMMVAHDVNPIVPYLDRVIYLGRGGAVIGSPEEVITGATLTALFATPIEVLRTSDGRLVVVGLPDAPADHGGHHQHA